MRKTILILITLFICVYGFAQDYTIQDRLEYDVQLDSLVVETFNTLEDAQQYIEENTIPSDTYVFDKYEWSIKEGVITDEEALVNRGQINDAITYAHNNGFTVFEVNDLDAYFEVRAGFGGSKVENYRRSIQLPSNFHLKMNENTYLRVQPNDKRDYALLCAFSEINVTVSGGHLVGDRYTHDYDGGDTGVQDLGYGLYFIGVVNGVVEGISADKFTGDGFIISSPIKRNDDGSENQSSHYGEVYFSKNLIVRNSTFDDNRRNGLALTDVEGALLENLTFTKTGLGVRGKGEPYGWQGVIPRHAIDLEAIQYFNDDGITLKLNEIVDDVIIRNSVFQNNYGDIDFYKASNVDVYGNTFTAGSGGVGAFNVKVHNNTFIADATAKDRGLNVKPLVRSDGSHFVKNWEIYDNVISGYKTAIQIGGENQRVENNIISDFKTGIFLLTGKDVLVKGNDLKSDVKNVKGIYNYPRGIDAINYTIINNEFDLTGLYGYGFDFKKTKGNNFVLDNCTFTQRVRISNSENITIKNSIFPSSNFNKENINITLENNN